MDRFPLCTGSSLAHHSRQDRLVMPEKTYTSDEARETGCGSRQPGTILWTGRQQQSEDERFSWNGRGPKEDISCGYLDGNPRLVVGMSRTRQAERRNPQAPQRGVVRLQEEPERCRGGHGKEDP